MNSNSQWDRAQAEYFASMGERRHAEAIRRPHPTGHLPMPEGEVEPVLDEPMPDYEAGDPPVNLSFNVYATIVKQFKYVTLTGQKHGVNAVGTQLYAELPVANAEIRQREDGKLVALDFRGNEHVLIWMVFTHATQIVMIGGDAVLR